MTKQSESTARNQSDASNPHNVSNASIVLTEGELSLLCDKIYPTAGIALYVSSINNTVFSSTSQMDGAVTRRLSTLQTTSRQFLKETFLDSVPVPVLNFAMYYTVKVSTSRKVAMFWLALLYTKLCRTRSPGLKMISKHRPIKKSKCITN